MASGPDDLAPDSPGGHAPVDHERLTPPAPGTIEEFRITRDDGNPDRAPDPREESPLESPGVSGGTAGTGGDNRVQDDEM